MKIMLVEDDSIISSGLKYSLEQEGFETAVFSDCKDSICALEKERFDLCLLDLSLPDGSGYDICRKVKATSDSPVIFLTACDDEVNIVMGLDMGADDYITKPFRIRELISRIHSVLRRCSKTSASASIIEIGDVKINTSQAKVFKNDNEVVLTALEYRLLLTLATSGGKVLTRNQLFEAIWDYAGNFVNDNTLTVYIKRLREKLEDDPTNPQIIKTIRGLGYKAGE